MFYNVRAFHVLVDFFCTNRMAHALRELGRLTKSNQHPVVASLNTHVRKIFSHEQVIWNGVHVMDMVQVLKNEFGLTLRNLRRIVGNEWRPQQQKEPPRTAMKHVRE
eukprot:3222783-Pleurochrysis_carterae.AAC.1